MIKLNQNQYIELNKKYDEHYKKYDYQSYELAKDVYLFGAASRQTEIDELKIKIMTIESTRKQLIDMKNLNIDALHVENERIQKEYQALFNEIDKLQKRIDELEIELKSIKHSTDQCLNAMSISCAEYLRENKKLRGLIDEALNVFKSDLSEIGKFDTIHNILKGEIK